MQWAFMILFTCSVLAMLGCTSGDPMDNNQTPTTTPSTVSTLTSTQTQPISDLEVIGIIQEYLETRTISVRYLSGSSSSSSSSISTYSRSRDSSSTYSYIDVDCRTRALQLMQKWEARRSENGAWEILAHSTQDSDPDRLTWEWRLFPSGVITTVEGPC